MPKMKDAAWEFLANKRVAVTGVSRKAESHGANSVYERLRQRGYQVFAVNPNADEVEGDPCYHDLKSIPGADWVVIGTKPETADASVHECEELGVNRVWMHQPPFEPGSFSESAAAYGREHGITVIAGGCPCMFNPTADPGHKMLRAMGRTTGKLPRQVQPPP